MSPRKHRTLPETPEAKDLGLEQQRSRGDRIRCVECGASWGGLNYAHCKVRGCHQTFSTVANFDAHQPKTQPRHTPCVHPSKVGLVPSKRGNGAWVSGKEDERWS